MWHDNETAIDYLNFGVVADACASMLTRADGEPISIGVSGGWGAGKSSLVKMIAARLEAPAEAAVDKTDKSRNTFVVLTFNPWLYQDLSLLAVLCFRSSAMRLFGLPKKTRPSRIRPLIYGVASTCSGLPS